MSGATAATSACQALQPGSEPHGHGVHGQRVMPWQHSRTTATNSSSKEYTARTGEPEQRCARHRLVRDKWRASYQSDRSLVKTSAWNASPIEADPWAKSIVLVVEVGMCKPNASPAGRMRQRTKVGLNVQVIRVQVYQRQMLVRKRSAKDPSGMRHSGNSGHRQRRRQVCESSRDQGSSMST
jgi:hypothetical protein